METRQSLKGSLILFSGFSPHSLGKLIEWKLGVALRRGGVALRWPPHSLGKLIEWKLTGRYVGWPSRPRELPTRWGN